MRKHLRVALFALGTLFGGASFDDAITDRYKDISPKEFLAAATTMTTVAYTGKRRKGDD